MENSLGVRLVDRNRQGIEPTEYGRALLDCGVAVFDDLRQGVKKIEFLADPTAGDVRIGCSHFVAASLVPAVIDQLSRRYPRISFLVAPGSDQALHRDLHERNVDFLVTWGASRFVDEQIAFEALFDDVHVVVAGAQSAWARRRKIELADLVNEPWVLPSSSSELGTVAKRAFRERGLNPRASVSSSPTEVRIRLLATGRFLTVVPASVLKLPVRRTDIKALPVELSTTSIPVGIITLKNRTLSPAAQLFIETAREVAKPLAQRKS
jgi:DNA-binding transcriptional LysR family regulator